MATAPTYCTHSQLKDVFPQVDSFDNKRAIYGWVQESALDDEINSNVNYWYATNTGLVTQLYKDGAEMSVISTSNLTTEKTQVKVEIAYGNSGGDVDSTTGLAVDDIIKIGNEYIQISTVGDSDSLTFVGTRNLFGTHSKIHAVDTSVYLAIDEDVDMAAEEYNAFLYDENLDLCIIAIPNDLNPNDMLMEAGEDFSTLITRMTANASRYLDAKLDPNLPREQLKDKEGNYDYIIVRTTALIAATFLIRSHDPTSEVANALMEDAMGNIDALNKGGAALSWQTTGDSSKGIIRDVTYTSGKIRPVDTRGRWGGTWDLLKVKVITGGVLGTATYSVWTKDGNSLKSTKVIDEQKITGDYQTLAGGLEIRFGGSSDSTQAAANDEWEVEVAGWQEEVDNATINSIKMTRGGTAVGRGKKKLGYNA